MTSSSTPDNAKRTWRSLAMQRAIAADA